MILQQDPVGLVTFDERIRDCLPPKSKRTQLGHVLSHLAKLKPAGKTDLPKSMTQLAAMLRHRSLLMLFSDMWGEPELILRSLRQLRHRGHDVILFHILDEAEVTFPFTGPCDFEDSETQKLVEVDADDERQYYLQALAAFRDHYRSECFRSGIDYVPLDTSMQFDKALVEYLQTRRGR